MNPLPKRKWKMRVVATGFLTVAGLGLVSSQAHATTVFVGSCHAHSATTIQAAISTAGSTVVEVCPGTYPEQLTISKPLILKGIVSGTSDAPVIAPPSGGMATNATSVSGHAVAAQVYVHDTTAVTIENLALDGTGTSGNGITSCTPELIGIYYQNASGMVNSVIVNNEVLGAGLGGCQSGLGIFADASSSTSVLTVKGSSVANYQKNGITGDDAGTTMTITGNTVIGQGPTTGAAENGIQLGFGATGKITGNTVLNNVYSPGTTGASGILVYASSNVFVQSNQVGNNQYGIALASDPAYGVADGATVTTNTISRTLLFDGIDVCSNSNTIKSNIIYASDESGINLDSSCGSPSGSSNIVSGNRITEACAGILLATGTTGNPTVTSLTATNATPDDVNAVYTSATDSCP